MIGISEVEVLEKTVLPRWWGFKQNWGGVRGFRTINNYAYSLFPPPSPQWVSHPWVWLNRDDHAIINIDKVAIGKVLENLCVRKIRNSVTESCVKMMQKSPRKRKEGPDRKHAINWVKHPCNGLRHEVHIFVIISKFGHLLARAVDFRSKRSIPRKF